MQTEPIVKKRKTLWCPRSSELPIESFRLDKWGLDVTIKKDISDLETQWDQLMPKDESFAQGKYLKTLEVTNPDNLKNLYVILGRDGKDIGAVLIQSLVLRPADSFDYEKYTTDRSFFSRVWQKIRQVVMSMITFRMMTIGNLYLTGQYGIHFAAGQYDKETQFDIISDLTKVLKKELCNTPYRFNGVLYKDFFKEQALNKPERLGFLSFDIDPNMILKLRASWMSFDDYLLDMKSKYRVRLKNALKKFKGIERRTLSLQDVERLSDRMYELYSSILEGSGFVLAQGKDNYFSELKRRLGEELQVVGYFHEEELVGFYTWVMEGNKMDSHFIGFEKSLNNKYQIYLNILLDLVKDAIQQKAQSLYYFRTALEIKSSVGAEPFDMTCYFRHNNPIINRVIRSPFKSFVPQQTWKQRHPFK